MSVIIFLILVSLLVAAGFLIAFLVSVKRGQFSDGFTPAIRILFDDKNTNKPLDLSKGEMNAD